MAPRARLYSLALAALCFILAAIVVSSGSAIGVSTAASAGSYAPTSTEPNPYLSTNVSLADVSLAESNPAFAYPTTIGASTTWSVAPGELDSRVLDPITVTPSDLQVPGVLSADSFVGPVSAPPSYYGGCYGNDAITHLQSTRCDGWNNSDLWTTFTDASDGGTGDIHTTVSNGTINGQTVVTITSNQSSARPFAARVGASITIPVSSLPSSNPSYDFISLVYSYEGASDNYAVPFVANSSWWPTLGLPYDSCGGESHCFVVPTGVYVPEVNATSEELIPNADTATIGNNADLSAIADDTYSPSGIAAADAIAGGTSGMLSIPLSAMNSAGAGFNLSLPGNGCTLRCTDNVSVGVFLDGNVNENLTIEGFSISTSSESLGEATTFGGYCYSSDCASGAGVITEAGYNFNPNQEALFSDLDATSQKGVVWDNHTAPATILGSYANPGQLSSFAPTWGNTGTIYSGVSEAWTFHASDLTNATVTLTPTTGTNGTGSFGLNFAWPASPDIDYGTVSIIDLVLPSSVTYSHVLISTQVSGNLCTGDMASTLTADQAAGLAGTQQPFTICSRTLGEIVVPSTTSYDPNNIQLLYLLSYTTLPGSGAPEPSNGTLLTNTYSVSGEWVIIGVIVLVVLLAAVYLGAEAEEKRKLRRNKSGAVRLGIRGASRMEHEGIGILAVLAVIGLGSLILYGSAVAGYLGAVIPGATATSLVVVFVILSIVLLFAFDRTAKARK